MDMPWIWSHNDILSPLVAMMVRASKPSVVDKMHMTIFDEKDMSAVQNKEYCRGDSSGELYCCIKKACLSNNLK